MKKIIVTITFFFLFPFIGFAVDPPVWVEGTDKSTATSVTNFTWSHTVTAGTNNALFVHCGANTSGNDDGMAITYNAVSMTEVAYIVLVNGNNWWFYLANPATGANNVAASWNTSSRPHCEAMTVSGVNQTKPIGASNFFDSSGAGVTGDIVASSSNSLMLNGLFNESADTSAWVESNGAQNLWDNTLAGNNHIRGSQRVASTSGNTYTNGWTWTTTRGSTMGVIEVQAPAVASAPPIMSDSLIFE